MKAIIFLCCLFLAASPGFAQKSVKTKLEKTDSDAIQKEIIRLEELGRVKALKKDTNWDDLWAEGAYMITALGTVVIYQKGQNLSAGGPAANSMKMSDMVVRIYSKVAIVTALMEVESETPDKKPFSFQLRFMNVWKKTEDGWKIIAAERTPVRAMPK